MTWTVVHHATANETRTETEFKPSRAHAALAKRVGKIAKRWDPYFPFLWEWTREVATAPHDVTEMIEKGYASMCIYIEEYRHYCRIDVPPQALEISEDELEATVLHELGHIFFQSLETAHANAVLAAGGKLTEHTGWHDAIETNCWRFAETLLRTKAS